MITYNYDEFMADCFGEYTKPTLEEFRYESEQTYTADRLSLYEYSLKLSEDDIRHSDFDSWSQTLYTGFIENFEYMMRLWFENTLLLKIWTIFFVSMCREPITKLKTVML